MLTEARLKEVLHYDPSTGVFTALVVKPQRKGKVGGAEPSGRLRIRVDSKRYAAARLAWLYVTGEWPSDLVDHKNGDPSDNRFDNLRDVTHQTNNENRHRPKRNSRSGFIGVSMSASGKYRAGIRIGGKHIFLGTFESPEVAARVYIEAKLTVHPGYATETGQPVAA